jgi:hypothetical protein
MSDVTITTALECGVMSGSPSSTSSNSGCVASARPYADICSENDVELPIMNCRLTVSPKKDTWCRDDMLCFLLSAWYVVSRGQLALRGKLRYD